MADPVTTVAPTPPTTLTLADYPRHPEKLLQWLVEVVAKQEVWQKGRMVALTPGATLEVVKAGLAQLQAMERHRAGERRTYLLNRWGTVMVGLDEAQPAEGDLIVCERRDGAREQCVVETGVAWVWRQGSRGLKFANVSTLVKWRGCEQPVASPAAPTTVASEVKAALERGRALAGNGDGLARRTSAPASHKLSKPPVT